MAQLANFRVNKIELQLYDKDLIRAKVSLNMLQLDGLDRTEALETKVTVSKSSLKTFITLVNIFHLPAFSIL